MDLLQVVILSIIEGTTEFLPISSTGHLVLASKVLNIAQTDFVKTFEIVIQLGAILSVVVYYWKTLILRLVVWKNILLAFIPTALIGLLLYKVIKSSLLGNLWITVAALFIGGLLLILIELYHKDNPEAIKNIEDLDFERAVLVGICQSLSVIPGVSRAGASIIGGMLVGLNRKTATEFSFLLAVPTMTAATTLDLFSTKFQYTNEEYLLLLIGFIGSFIFALASVRWFIGFVQKNNFIPFGIYRIVLAFLFWLIYLR